MPGNIMDNHMSETLTWPLGAYISLFDTINNKQEIKLFHSCINWMDISLNKMYVCG